MQANSLWSEPPGKPMGRAWLTCVIKEHELRKCHAVAVVQVLSRVWLFVTPWTAAHQASLPFTVSQSLLKLMSIESVVPSKDMCSSQMEYISLNWSSHRKVLAQRPWIFIFENFLLINKSHERRGPWGGVRHEYDQWILLSCSHTSYS